MIANLKLQCYCCPLSKLYPKLSKFCHFIFLPSSLSQDNATLFRVYKSLCIDDMTYPAHQKHNCDTKDATDQGDPSIKIFKGWSPSRTFCDSTNKIFFLNKNYFILLYFYNYVNPIYLRGMKYGEIDEEISHQKEIGEKWSNSVQFSD